MTFQRHLLLCFSLLTVLAGQTALRAEPTVVTLDPNRTEVINLQPLVVTTLTFRTSAQFGAIVMGSKIVKATFDPATRTVELYPDVSSGQTSMNATIGGKVYTFVLKIDPAGSPDFRRTYTLNADEGGDVDMSAAANARPMKPQDVDTIDCIRKIDRAHADPTYRQTLSDYYVVPIGKTEIWNDSPVTLVEANAFAALDLIVLKVEWSNASNSVLHLDSRQVELRIAGRPIPVTACQQVSDHLFPGQMDTIWLFVQGYHLSPKNEWVMVLPPDAASVTRLLQR